MNLNAIHDKEYTWVCLRIVEKDDGMCDDEDEVMEEVSFLICSQNVYWCGHIIGNELLVG